MELKLKKYINNTKKFPKYEVGKADYGSAASGLINATALIYDAHLFDTTDDDYINKYGGSNSNIGEIGYYKYNDIDRSKEMDIVGQQNTKNTFMTTAGGATAGAALGSIVPGVGTTIGAGVGALVGGIGGLIGGLFGGASRKRKARRALEEALLKVDNYNEMNRSGALTQLLQMNQAEKYGDTRSLFLGYSAGKPKFVHTAQGLVPGVPNADTNFGETIQSENGDVHVVNEGHGDTAQSNIKASDRIYGKTKDPYFKQSYEDLVRPAALMKEKILRNRPKGVGSLGEASRLTYNKAIAPIERQLDEYINYIGNRMDITMANEKYKCGKPKYSPGKRNEDGNIDTYGLNWWTNAIPSGVNALLGLGQYFSAKGDTPYKPDTYIANRFLTKGLSTLGGLRVSEYPIILQLRDAEARTNYAINASGGLSTAQKNLARISSLNGTQQLIGNALLSIQQQNNAYKAAYANAMLQSGESEAQRRQLAKQYDLDYYSKSHAARQQMMQTGLYNASNAMWQYAANEFKRKNAIANIGLYAANNESEDRKIREMLKNPYSDQKVQLIPNWTFNAPLMITPTYTKK